MSKDYTTLSEKQRVFVEKYLEVGNQTEAARLAGYKKPRSQGARLIKHENVKQYMDELRSRRQEKGLERRERVLKELFNIAYSKVTDVVDFDGQSVSLKPNEEIPEEAQRAIQSISATTTKKGSTTINVKFHSKLSALDQINKMQGYYENEDNKSTGLTFMQQINNYIEKKSDD